MRTVVRNNFARHTIRAERVPVDRETCTWCGQQRYRVSGHGWLYRYHADDDGGSRHSGPLAGGRLFCCRGCAESYLDAPFDETAKLS